jgi:phosphoglycolate phosphatase-like HAD superfamily hydrolase
MIRHIIWDLDGTLFDTYPAFCSAFLIALSNFGQYPEPEMVLELTQVGLSHCAATLAGAYQLSTATLEQAFSYQYSEIPYDKQSLMPGSQELCAYIVSIGGKNVIVTHRQRRSAIGLLKAQDLGKLIADIITGNDDFPKKPDPTAMKAIMARNEIAPQEGLAIGDRALDIEAGQAAGLQTCLFGEGDYQVQPDYRVNYLGDLIEIIQQENQID